MKTVFIPMFAATLTLGACKLDPVPAITSTQYSAFPLFEPHMKTFECTVEAKSLPPVDAQADMWFIEASSLENADIHPENLDFTKIIRLLQMAADRHHWKAMLNLASLYVEGRDPKHGNDDAVRLVEEAIHLGVPAAFDRMGSYLMNGTGVHADPTGAFAFIQKAALMGNPEALSFLGEKMSSGYDLPKSGYWSNIPVAIKMMECSLAQGYGKSAQDLEFMYRVPRDEAGETVGQRNSETMGRTLRVLHQGAKYGCASCADALLIEFGGIRTVKSGIAPFIDKARAARYDIFGNALVYDPNDRFPNLDKVLPLPPAVLPPWNGDRDTLLNAARGVVVPFAPVVTAGVFLDPAFELQRTSETTSKPTVPVTAFWKPTAPGQGAEIQQRLASAGVALRNKGEQFGQIHLASGKAIDGLVWERWITVHRYSDQARPRGVTGRTREIVPPEQAMSTSGAEACPATGIWQPWLPNNHRLHHSVNQPWRQAWLVKGQAFPKPKGEWLLDVGPDELQWHLMDDAPPNIR